jgi:hypothetical protein
MFWFMLNIPLAVAIFLAITGIPIALVIRHPDQRPTPAAAAGRGPADQAGDPAVIREERELVGASAAG